jgi:hypothetical protein
MRKFLVTVGTIGVMAMAGQARAAIINGGFEAGLAGWTESQPALSSAVGSAAHLQCAAALGCVADPGTFQETEGANFGYLLSGAGAGVYTLVSQAFNAVAGSALQFNIFFDAGDYVPFNDNGYAKLYNADTNALIATLYNKTIGVNVASGGFSDWELISHTFAATGNYKIEFGVNNGLDNALASAVGVDAVTQTPEPASMILLGSGLLGLASRRLRRKQ